MKHLDIRRELSDRLRDLLSSENEALPVTPRPYQIDAIGAVNSWLEDPGGPPRAHIAHATGLGKTTIFSLITRSCVGLRTLIIVPTKVLVEQVARVVTRFTGGVVGHMASINRIRNEHGDVVSVRGHEHQDTVITTNASFKMYAARILADFNPHFIAYDECHWAYVHEYQQALGMFSEAVILGFSATPDYLGTVVKGGYIPVTLDNGQVLWGDRQRFAETHFGPRLDSRSLRWGIENGYLSPLAWGMIEFNADLSNLPIKDGEAGPDYDPKALQSAMAKHWPLMTQTICRLYKNAEYDLPSRQTFAVCPSVGAAEELAEAVSQEGIPAACVTGDSTTLERNTILSAFAAGETKFISSVMVLREGWDAPAEVCMMLRPTKSRVAYEQYLGRTTRLSRDGSSKVALMLDLHQQNGTFSPLSAPMLFGQPHVSVHCGGILIPRDPTGDDDVQLSPYLPENVTPKLVIVPALEYTYHSNEDGFLTAGEEEWGTIHGLKSRFRLSINAIQLRINAAHCRSQRGFNHQGQRVVFYAVNDVRLACADLLANIPELDDKGFCVFENKTWGHLKAHSRRLRLSCSTISQRITSAGYVTIDAYDSSRRRATCYSVEDVDLACADLIQQLHRAGGDGFFEADGKRWGTIFVHKKRLNIGTSEAISLRLNVHEVEGREGYDRTGRLLKFYSTEDVDRACIDLIKLQQLHRAGDDGFFEADGKRWGTLSSHAERLGLSVFVTKVAVRASPAIPRDAHDRVGKLGKFYSEQEVDQACKHLLKSLPRADAKGVIRVDNERLTTLNKHSERLGLSDRVIKLRASVARCKSTDGIDSIGRPAVFYSMEDIDRACADLLKKKRSQENQGSRKQP